MHAISVGADQVLIAPAMLLAKPRLFWEKLTEHQVTITFAPNFFLALAVKALEGENSGEVLNLSKLRHVVSGGEANLVSTGKGFNEAVVLHAGQKHVLKTAFGMTEVGDMCLNTVSFGTHVLLIDTWGVYLPKAFSLLRRTARFAVLLSWRGHIRGFMPCH